MNNDLCTSSQARIYTTRLDWRPLDDADREALSRNSGALYFLRTWRKTDDEFGLQWAGVCEGMATITIVFRAGCRRVEQYTRSFGDPLKRALWDAEDILAQQPRLSEVES